MKKHKLSPSLRRVWIGLAATLLFAAIADLLAGYRYPRQMAWVGCLVCGVLTLRALLKHLHTVHGSRIGAFAGRISSAVSRFFSAVSARTRRLLGLPPRRTFTRGEDEKHFLFGRFASHDYNPRISATPRRARDIRDNTDRIRLLYYRYVSRLIRRGRYVYRRQHTASDIRRGVQPFLKDEDGSQLLVDTYEACRYAAGSAVSDETVAACQKVK